MAKPRPPLAAKPAARPVHPLLAGHDLTTHEGEEAARQALYRWLTGRAQWIDLCEAEARRRLGWPADDPRDTPENAFIAASHDLMLRGVEPPDGLDPDWFPPEVHALVAKQGRRQRQGRGTSRHIRRGWRTAPASGPAASPRPR